MPTATPTHRAVRLASRPRLARTLALLLLTSALTVVTAAVTVTATTTTAQAAWSAPAFVRSISGNGRPGVFPWGTQYNPVSGEVLVGDYLNNQVRRYSPDGRILGTFYRPDAGGQPYSLSVDPRNGDVYVPEIADGQANTKVAQYTAAGVFVRTLTLSDPDYIAWLTVDDRGQLIQADSHYANNTTTNPPTVRFYRLSDGRRTRSFNVLPPGTTSSTVPRLYGIDNDAAGNVWLTDTFNNRILKYSSTGTFLAAYGTGVFHGDARGMAVDDARNRLYVSDASIGVVQVFDLQGNHLETIGGGGGTGPLDLGAPRQPAVGPDGTLYVAEYGNARVHRFTPAGEDAGWFPRPAQPAIAGQLGEPRDVDVDDQTGDVWVADSWNQRVQRFAPTGEFLGTFGNRSANPEYGMNYPRGIGIDPVSRRVWVANQRGHHIKRYDYDGTYVDTLGNAEVDSTAAGYFRWPLDLEFQGGRALVTDRNSNKVKLLDAATGAELKQFTRDGQHGGALDPVTGDVYVSTATNVYRYDPTGTTVLASWGGSGTTDGRFRHIWDVVVSNGVVYVTDDLASRVQAFTTAGVFLGKWGGFGQGAYQFKNPSGIAAGADGLLYVADAGNDRVTVFDPASARGGGAWPPPTVTLDSPGQDAVLPGQAARLTGTVTDETGVAGVQVAVQDRSTGRWFDASTSTWSTTQTWAGSPLSGANTTAMRWSWGFIGVEYAGRYHAEARAVDVAGNTSTVVTRNFSLVPEDTADTAPPATVLASPAAGTSTALEPPVVLSGDAADETGVATVEVRVRRAGTGLFLQADGSFATATSWLPAALAEPFTAATAWSWSWAAPEPGTYEVATRSTDTLGNGAGEVTVHGQFTLTAVLPPDTTAPVLADPAPARNQTVAAPLTALGGTLVDDRAAASVDVAVRDRTSGLWLQADGSWVAVFAWRPAVLADPGAPTSAWSAPVALAAGAYGYQVRARDAAGNPAAQPFWPFTVAGS